MNCCVQHNTTRVTTLDMMLHGVLFSNLAPLAIEQNGVYPEIQKLRTVMLATLQKRNLLWSISRGRPVH